MGSTYLVSPVRLGRLAETARRLFLAALLGVATAVPLAAQAGTGRIVGRVVADDGTPVAGARVTIVGKTLATSTRIDGRYSLESVPAGPVVLRVAMIGFTAKSVTGIVVAQGKATNQDVSLKGMVAQLEELTVTATAERGSVTAAVDEQKQSIAIVTAISAEQIKRSPDGDAATVLQRMSGATLQDGKYLNVRGLGDRYTQASLNGARIPSPEPERKVVPLDLFPSALLNDVATSKSFTPDQSGDFSGAAVDIRTREFQGASYMAFSSSVGFNDAVSGRRTAFAPATGRDFLALGAAPRALPANLASQTFQQPLSPAESNGLVNSFRDVWSARQRTGSPNGSFGASLGGSVPVLGTELSYLFSGSYSYTQETRADEQRAVAQPSTTAGGDVTEFDRYDGSTGRNSALWGGIVNFNLPLWQNGKLSLNSMYNRTMDNEGRMETGTSENLALPLVIQRLRYVERNIYSTQLGLQQGIGDRHFLNLGVSLAGVARKEPDRSEIVYETSTGTPSWYGFASEAAVRTFADLHERSFEGNANWQLRLGATPSNRFLQLGALYRSTSRDAENRAYSISLTRPLSESERALRPEELFDGRFTQGSDAVLRLLPLGAGGSYDAKDNMIAGYGMLTLELGRSLELIGGARVEHSAVEVNSVSTAGEPSVATPRYTDVLPSLALNFRLGENLNLRASASQTLSRPEYRELSPILFREVIGGDNVKGNPDLKRSLIRNFDLRWEWYPRGGEVLSVAVFAKQFNDPIERIYQGTSGTRIISYVNAEGADNYGIELEARQGLDRVVKGLNAFTVFANATFMKSQIRIDPGTGSLTKSERKMVGQAPYVFNAGITWKHPSADASATVLFNRIGERIREAGELPLPDVIEQPRNVLDASIQFPIFGALTGKVDGKNLLDARYRITQGTVVREGYRAGRIFTMGFSWRK